MSDEPQELPQEQPQEDIQTLKNEIKNELKEEMRNYHHRRKHRVLYTIGVFLIGAVVGFGGGVASHFEHHSGYKQGNFHMQKGNQMPYKNFQRH